MKILLIGATGGTGQHVLTQALEQGHEVTTVVRNPLKIKLKSPNLKIIQGDILTSTLDDAFSGQEAVICCLGVPANKAKSVRSDGTANIIKAMKKATIDRLICQSSLGFDDSVDVLNCTSFLFRNMIVPYILKATFKDHSLQEKVVKQSNLNWTIVRPGSLTNGVKTGHYNYGFSYSDPTLKVKISRADVADFLLKQLGTEEFRQKVVGISY